MSIRGKKAEGQFCFLLMLAAVGVTNRRGEGFIPDSVTIDIMILNSKAFFESDEGIIEFEKWTIQKIIQRKSQKKKWSEDKPRSDP